MECSENFSEHSIQKKKRERQLETDKRYKKQILLEKNRNDG